MSLMQPWESAPFHGYEFATMLDGSWGIHAAGSDETHADFGIGPFQLGGGFYGLADEFRISDAALERPELLVDFPYQEVLATITPKVEITFPTYRHNYYNVEWTQDLSSGIWQHLEPTCINGKGFPATVTDPGGFGQQRFYRVHEYE